MLRQLLLIATALLLAASASALPITLVGGPLVAPDTGSFTGFSASLAPGADTANGSLTFIVSSPNGTNTSYEIGEPSLVMGPLGGVCDAGCTFLATTPLGNFLFPNGGPGSAWTADLDYINPLAGGSIGDSFGLTFNDYTALVSTGPGTLEVVPEPSTLLFVATGLAGLAAAGRRRSLH